MDTLKSCVILSGAALILAGCGLVPESGSGHLESQDRSIPGVRRISVGDGCKAHITRGDTALLVVKCDDNVMDHLNLVQDGDEISVAIDHPPFFCNYTLEVDATIDTLASAAGSGGSTIEISGFSSTRDLSIELSGGSRLNGGVECGNLTANCSGGSILALSGVAGDALLAASGGSKLYLDDLVAQDIAADLSGGSNANVTACGTVTGSLSGGSNLTWDGTGAQGSVETSGGSKVRKR